MNRKALGQSITAKLANLARTESIAFANLRTQFLIERLIERIAASKNMDDLLIYKGGYVSLRIYESPRFTTDIDALSMVPIHSIIEQIRVAIETTDDIDSVWFRFEGTADLKTQGNYPGTRLIFRAGIGEIPNTVKNEQFINLDLSSGDLVFPKVKSHTTDWLVGEGTISWKVYPPESIVSEKLHALISRGSLNSRSKDIFDINFLLKRCDKKYLSKAIETTFKGCGETAPTNIIETMKAIDTTRLKKGWKSATVSIGKIDFEETFESLLEQLESKLL